jgi:dTDP-3-amino-3,4,6-trideoxy-alpha-D-glucose transaminase
MILANDFRAQWKDVGKDVLDAVERVGSSGWYILGAEVRDFECSLAATWGLREVVGVASGLDAIEISLRALGCKPGDRVLTTPISAFATTLAILKVGAIPVFSAVDRRGLMDLSSAREALRRRPEIRFVVPVHLYGHALDLIALEALRAELGVKVVEDCAQSIGAQFHGRTTGSAGDAAATSFYPTKNLGAMGDGGALLTNSTALAEAGRELRDYGQRGKYRHTSIGYNSRLDELQAAILRTAFLPRLAGWTARRREIAERYRSQLTHPEIHVPGAPDGSASSWHLFPLLVEPQRKAPFLAHMKSQGVACGEHYPIGIPDQEAMRGISFEYEADPAPARRFCASEVSLPIHPYLTDADVERVIQACNGWEA